MVKYSIREINKRTVLAAFDLLDPSKYTDVLINEIKKPLRLESEIDIRKFVTKTNSSLDNSNANTKKYYREILKLSIHSPNELEFRNLEVRIKL